MKLQAHETHNDSCAGVHELAVQSIVGSGQARRARLSVADLDDVVAVMQCWRRSPKFSSLVPVRVSLVKAPRNPAPPSPRGVSVPCVINIARLKAP